MITTEYFQLIGGLNLVDPPIMLPPGQLLYGMNYEAAVRGGYRRIDGFERFDGQASPSDADYYTLNFDVGTAAISDGETVTGATSGATGIAVADAVVDTGAYVSNDATGHIALTAISGVFQDNEQLKVGAVNKSTSNGTAVLRGAETVALDTAYLASAREYYRALIAAVPGSGQMRGVHIYNGDVYAFRDNAGATACAMYKSTSSGWALQDLGRTLDFTSGGTYEVVEQDTITGATSGATATVERIILTSGSWAGGDAAGRLILSGQTGAFQAENLDVGANPNVATIAADSTAITLAVGGRYEFVNYNFGGSTGTYRMYGCDGVNTAFEWDGSVFVPIITGMTTDTPEHIATFKKHLFLSFAGGSAQHSSIGDPYTWSPVTGAAELAIGEEITGFKVLRGDAMAIFGRNQVYVLYGTSVSDWVLQLFSDKTGAIPWTIQDIGRVRYLDDRGLTDLMATDAYGNFASATFSQLIKPLVDSKRGLSISSCIVRNKNQYRIFFSDNTGFIATFNGDSLIGFTQVDYGIPVRVVASEEDSTGDEVLFFGADDGYIYQMDKGVSFDGSAIEAYLSLPYYNYGTPTQKKRFRKIIPELEAEATLDLQIKAEFSYGSSSLPSTPLDTVTVIGGGATWNNGNWNQFFWSNQDIETAEARVNGVGLNMGIYFYSSSLTEPSHTLHGMTVHYSMRGIKR